MTRFENLDERTWRRIISLQYLKGEKTGFIYAYRVKICRPYKISNEKEPRRNRYGFLPLH